jgi:hypothetical protein
MDLFSGDPLGEPVEHAGPLPQGPDDALADADVIAGDIELGVTAGRKIDTVRIGDPHSVLAHGQLHCRSLAPRGRHEASTYLRWAAMAIGDWNGQLLEHLAEVLTLRDLYRAGK